MEETQKNTDYIDYFCWEKTHLIAEHIAGKGNALWPETGDLSSDEWKKTAESPFYDYKYIAVLRDELQRCTRDQDLQGLLGVVRRCLHKNVGGVENRQLYQQCLVGTKHLIQDFYNSVSAALLWIHKTNLLSDVSKLKFFKEIRNLYGRSALLLSGGGSLGVYHFGVIKALFEAGFLPQVISGSSVGSLVAALVCSRKNAELQKLFHLRNYKYQKTTFSDVIGGIKRGEVVDKQATKKLLIDNIGDFTFLEAYDHSGRILNISVSCEGASESRARVLNYVTAPNVLVWSAVYASCSVPGLVKPSPLMVRLETGKVVSEYYQKCYMDGSYAGDLPMMQLADVFAVNFFIVSQVNPYVLPFISGDAPASADRGRISNAIGLMQRLLTSEVQHRISQLIEFDIAPRPIQWLFPVLNQRYEGDITVTPKSLGWIQDIKELFSIPSEEKFEQCVQRGVESTWPHVTRIKNHIRIEHIISKAVSEFRGASRKTAPMEIRMPRAFTLQRVPWLANPQLDKECFTIIVISLKSPRYLCDFVSCVSAFDIGILDMQITTEDRFMFVKLYFSVNRSVNRSFVAELLEKLESQLCKYKVKAKLYTGTDRIKRNKSDMELNRFFK